MSNFLVGIGAAVAAGFFGGEAPAACAQCLPGVPVGFYSTCCMPLAEYCLTTRLLQGLCWRRCSLQTLQHKV